ncbi:MAG: sodium-dependent transporter [Kiritimatiellae bacterium]|nr:sodium-dependent transporter [Kiritimatiellia bacterium]
MEQKQQRARWSGRMAFVIAAAASAIGLGNLWRFPYLAAKYGGGAFIFIYVALASTVGYVLMSTEIAIGRMTRQSQLTAYSALRSRWGFVGVLGTVVPALILPCYFTIGGWTYKYLAAYAKLAFSGAGEAALSGAGAHDFFASFIAAPAAPCWFALAFGASCAAVIALGVRNGIEKANLVMMPLLLLMAAAIAVYVAFLPGAGKGLEYYFVPNLDFAVSEEGGFSFAKLSRTLLGAAGQMFYSLSLAMGIMITYGSYMRGEDSITSSARRIEFFDTLVAVLAGMSIVPAVYAVAAKTGAAPALDAGPGLMFETLPEVFATFGRAGAWTGFAFFLLVTMAALTSGISLLEACVASVCDRFRLRRIPSTVATSAVLLALTVFPALGYGTLAGLKIRLFDADGQSLLDFFDFTVNSLVMPVVAAATCVFAGWALGPDAIAKECGREKAGAFYRFMVRWFVPALMAALLVSETCRSLGIGGWKI